MLRSMTGFGAATAEKGGETLTVEIRTVNHRFADVKVRGARELLALEAAINARVRARIERGNVEVILRRTPPPGGIGRVRLDLDLARAYATRLAELGQALDLTGTPALIEIASLDGVLSLEDEPLDLERLQGLLEQALDDALDHVVSMREREGSALYRDIRERLDHVGELVADLRDAAPGVVEAWRDRLIERVADLTAAVEVDSQRIALEVAILAERSDVAEELTRLASHLTQFAALLDGEGAIGRKLDFLMQEMNREVNTIGSKSQSTDIAQRVVDLKAELERIREQVQNVE